MKKNFLFPALMMGLVSFAFVSCDDKTTEPNTEYVDIFEANADAIKEAATGTKLSTADIKPIIENYINNVVIPTYSELNDRVVAFKGKVDVLVAASTPTQAMVDDACEAWRSARKPWERSEAFLFGPADAGQYDPSMDSWPLDKNGIDQQLASGNFDEIEDQDDEAAQNLRGFHTAEYLLFDSGNNRQISDFTANPNIAKYLKIVATHLSSDAKELYTAWNEGIPSSSEDKLKKAYGAAMINLVDGFYANYEDVIGDIFNDEGGMPAISNEVGEAKIGDPVNLWNKGDKENAVLAVESWYSWNSLDDYVNNIVSIQNCYLGRKTSYDNADGSDDAVATNSFSNMVKKVNPKLDELLRKQITATVEAIRDIPYPLRNNLDKTTQIKNAQEACACLTNGLQKIRVALTGAIE